MNRIVYFSKDEYSSLYQSSITTDYKSLQITGNDKLLSVIFMIDVSQSMDVDGKMEAVNSALYGIIAKLKTIKEENALDLRVSLMTFASDVQWNLYNIPIDEVSIDTLVTRKGLTSYGAAFEGLNEELKADRLLFHTGKMAAPAIVFMTDGKPVDVYQHDLDLLLENTFFVYAGRSVLLAGDAIGDIEAQYAVEQFVENPTEDILSAGDSSLIAERLKLATLHTLGGSVIPGGENEPVDPTLDYECKRTLCRLPMLYE